MSAIFTDHDLALAILRARFGMIAEPIWATWTPEQQDEAAEAAAAFRPIFERAAAEFSSILGIAKP